jgi:hypothetical protein
MLIVENLVALHVFSWGHFYVLISLVSRKLVFWFYQDMEIFLVSTCISQLIFYILAIYILRRFVLLLEWVLVVIPFIQTRKVKLVLNILIFKEKWWGMIVWIIYLLVLLLFIIYLLFYWLKLFILFISFLFSFYYLLQVHAWNYNFNKWQAKTS